MTKTTTTRKTIPIQIPLSIPIAIAIHVCVLTTKTKICWIYFVI